MDSSNLVARKWLQEYASGYSDNQISDKIVHHLENLHTLLADKTPDLKSMLTENIIRYFTTPLDYFISNGQMKELKDYLSTSNKSAICGKVFNAGEPTYTCRDCAMDPTCVMCNQCFQNSIHKDHRYRMHTSAGGAGCCDCGDAEAWKSGYACDFHLANDVEAAPVQLPLDVERRCSIVFDAVLRYAITVLLYDGPDDMPAELFQMSLPPLYVTTLYNDEVHTYQEVIRQLQLAISCTELQASQIAGIVDRTGRARIGVGDAIECNRIRRIIQKRNSELPHIPIRGAKPLVIKILHTTLFEHQELAINLLNWLNDFTSSSSALILLFGKIAMDSNSHFDKSYLEILLHSDTQLWKDARTAWHQLCMACILGSSDLKHQFSVLYVKEYAKIQKDFIEDDHLHSVSITSMSVQLFTSNSLSRYLVIEHDCLAKILSTFCNAIKPSINPVAARDGRLAQLRIHELSRLEYMIIDVKYILSQVPDAESWTDDLKHAFLRGFDEYLKLLSILEGMESSKRVSGRHIEYEPNWEFSVRIYITLCIIAPLILQWCTSNLEILKEATGRTIKILCETCYSDSKSLLDHAIVDSIEYQTINYDVSSELVSLVYPLSRLLAGLMSSGSRHNHESICELLPTGREEILPILLMEHSVRALVLAAQVASSMWKFNGYYIVNQVHHYKVGKCRSQAYDKDILMLQIVGSIVDPDWFLACLLQKFKLLDWVDIQGGSRIDNLKEDIWVARSSLAREFLLLLIAVIGERYHVGIGDVTPADTVRHEILHYLYVSPKAHSEITKFLSTSQEDCAEVDIDEVLSTIANYRKPGLTGRGVYELKPEYYEEYNPFFYHYSVSDHSKAEERRKRIKTESDNRNQSPPSLPKLTKPFYSLNRILQSSLLRRMLLTILTRCCEDSQKNWIDPLLHPTLFLIAMNFGEIESAYREGFINLNSELSLLSEIISKIDILKNETSASDFSKLINWIISTYRKLVSFTAGSNSVTNVTSETTGKNRFEEAKRARARLAAQQRNKIMAQMSAMQKNFLTRNADILSTLQTDSLTDPESSETLMEMNETDEVIAVGASRSCFHIGAPETISCILCQEDEQIKLSDRPMVLTGLSHRSVVLSQLGSENDTKIEFKPLWTDTAIAIGVHTGSCAHAMHSSCWQNYFVATVDRQQIRRFNARAPPSINVTKGEYLCPLCEGLCNCAIPILPPLPYFINNDNMKEYPKWLEDLRVHTINELQNIRGHTGSNAAMIDSSISLFTPLDLLNRKSSPELNQLRYELPEAAIEAIKAFSQSVYTSGLLAKPCADNERILYALWSSCAYCIGVAVNFLSFRSKSVEEGLTTRQISSMSALLRAAVAYTSVNSIRFQTWKTLHNHILSGKYHLQQKMLGSIYDMNYSELKALSQYIDRVTFTLTVTIGYEVEGVPSVNLIFSLQALSDSPGIVAFGTDPVMHHYCLKIAFMLKITQSLLAITDIDVSSENDESSDDDSSFLVQYWQFLQMHTGKGAISFPYSASITLCRKVKEVCLPFLRMASLFFHLITSVPVPKFDLDAAQEYSHLLKYLDLPAKLSTLLDLSNSEISGLVIRWCNTKNVILPIRELSPCSTLINLPRNYGELICGTANYRCSNSKASLNSSPAMCLICGKLVCAQNYCCQGTLGDDKVGSITSHIYECGAGVGILLFVRECRIILRFGQRRGCFYSPPYLDEHGETDEGLRRGNPLFLDDERYSKLQNMWLLHEVSGEVVRNMEHNTRHAAYIDWSNM
ncbi:E3 ubiquitin-protein ligase UBR2 [Trichoplax sp. H2]|nr:E3 ubiquitin-protein ligase UBR2 [Trichoplax sp. H2]|eukprot:RDD37274.1 E3 ubiquitin-protein ligase UBR2 [Trichoplax sp. H2]